MPGSNPISRTHDKDAPHAGPLLPSLAGEPRRLVELAKQVWAAARGDTFLWRLALALLAIDAVFILVNLVALALALSPKLQAMVNIDLGFVLSPALSVNTDGGLPEMTNYAKTAATAALLYLCSRRHAQPIYLAGAVAFLIIVVDDALMIHETTGGYLAARFDLPSAGGLRPQDLGELGVYATWALVIGALGIYGIAASSAVHIRAAMLFAGVIGFIAFFSVVVDMAEIAIYWQFRRAALMIGVIEDGGEMIGMTIALILALTLWRHPSLVRDGPAPTAR